jgi:LuxR family transcriptional regulator, maltose regulon positive regulatory protein
MGVTKDAMREELSLVQMSPVDGMTPPLVRAEWVARPRLWWRLERALRSQVVLIAAPAGYGKSTLLTQWAACRDGSAVAWVQLDRADNDPTRLWAHVAMALGRVGCAVEVNGVEFVTANAMAMVDRVVPRVAQALADHGRRLTLVFEDLHLLRSTECSEQLKRLIDLLPSSVRVVLASRSDPLMRLGRLRVEGRLAEIRAADLAFTVPEAAALVAGQGISVSDSVVTELVEASEGWPAALYLAALSLAGRPDPDDFVHRLSGNDRFIADYLSEEVLARLDPELRAFILDMSVFDQFNAELASEAAQTGCSSRLLHQLERTNLFLISLSGGGWFRFHHLFRTFARSTLEMERPDRVDDLHRRGASWFLTHGDVEEAVHHLLAAGDTEEAARLIQTSWLELFDAGRSATVTSWLTQLHATPAAQGAAATVTGAWMAGLTGDVPDLRRHLTALASMTSDQALPDGTTSPRAALLLVRGLFGYDGPDQLVADARDAAELETDPASPWHAVACAALGHAGYLTGDAELARRMLAAGATSPVAPRTIQILADGLRALLEDEQGNTALSRRYAQQAMATVTDHGMHAMPHVLPAYTASGVVLAADGQLNEAMTILEVGLRTRRQTPGLSPWPLIHHLIAMVSVARRLGDLDKARTLLAEVDTLVTWPDASLAQTKNRIAVTRVLPSNRRPTGVLLGTPDAVLGEPLTPREVEILRRLRGTQTLREIAADLYVSHNTVKTITSSIYRKLGAHARAEAVTVARAIALRPAADRQHQG